MPTSSTIYSQEAIDSLTERTAYEGYLLDEVFDLERRSQADRSIDELVFRAEDGRVVLLRTVCMHWNASSPGPIFKSIGSPLLFVTAFKLLDMVVEWMLEVNGVDFKVQFDTKLKPWEGGRSIELPPFLASETRLKEVLLSLFERLYPFRNAIIHRKSFRFEAGVLTVEDDKFKPGKDPRISLSGNVLEALSDFAFSLVQIFRGARPADVPELARMRYLSDQLATLHKKPSFGQLRPDRLRLNYFFGDEPSSEQIDVAHVKSQAIGRSPEAGFIFELVAGTHGSNSAWRLTQDQLHAAPNLVSFTYLREHGELTSFSSSARKRFEDFAAD